MQNGKEKMMDRRAFLKRAGAGAAASAALLAGCAPRGKDSPAGERAAGDVPEAGMTYRINPNTGDRVSLLGYGCMRWPMMPNPDGEGEIIDQEQTNALVDYALAHGVNYFDTAPLYLRGLSEAATGTALSRHPRESYYIATKLSNHHIARKGLSGKRLYDASLAMYRESFERLRTDYIDYYLLHNVGGDTGLPFLMTRFFDSGVLGFLLKEREAGRIRNLGFSYHGDVKVFDYLLSLHDEIHWDFVQIQLNYADYRHASGNNFNAEYLYAELEKRDIPAVIMEPLLGGRLASLNNHLNDKLKERSPRESIASWAFRFSGSFPGVLSVLSGMTYMEHLQDNIRTYSPLRPLSEEEFAFLEDVATEMTDYPTIPCNACDYCMPCPYGIDIPGIFAHYNKCINEGNMPASSRDENYARARRAFLIGYDRSVPKLRQADHCIGCGQCAPDCPQSIRIPYEMRRIDEFAEKLKRGNGF